MRDLLVALSFFFYVWYYLERLHDSVGSTNVAITVLVTRVGHTFHHFCVCVFCVSPYFQAPRRLASLLRHLYLGYERPAAQDLAKHGKKIQCFLLFEQFLNSGCLWLTCPDALVSRIQHFSITLTVCGSCWNHMKRRTQQQVSNYDLHMCIIPLNDFLNLQSSDLV